MDEAPVIVATVTIRATHATATDAEKLMRLAELCAELAEFNRMTIDGWQVEVLAAVEAQCSFTRDVALLTRNGLDSTPARCDQAATTVVGGAELCDWHANVAPLMLAAIGRTA